MSDREQLQYGGEAANNKTGGSAQSYDGRIASPPLVRTERYEASAGTRTFQSHYQAHLIGSCFPQPVVSYIPNPGAIPQVQGT